MADDSSEDDYIASGEDEYSSSPSENAPPNAPSAQYRRTHPYPKPNQKPIRGYLSKAYRDLLNTEIEDVNARNRKPGLDASHVGASRWTSREKDALFQCLASRSPDDLPALGRAVCTKSEPEIRAYLLLLQAGVISQDSKQVNLQKKNVPLHEEIPAAAEISPEGEHVLDLAADALAVHVEKHIHQQQRDRFGDEWLVDADVAERMDVLQDQNRPDADINAIGLPEADGMGSGAAHSGTVSHATFESILRPSAFLQLSRNLYMNNSEDDNLNWHHVDSMSTDPMEPALFRTALEDFRQITVSITRRIVQATIFQATSRLRAEDASRKDWSPLGAIREVDVRTAVDFLHMPCDSKRYWATAARRCRVGVFSDSKKYADGRPSTKSGHLLTYEEVESELGLPRPKDSGLRKDSDTDILDEDDFLDMDDSDLFTEEEHAVSSDELPQESEGPAPTKITRKRKRALSPRSSLRAETTHLNAIDEAASMRDEKRLWELLRLDPPEHISRDRETHLSLNNAKPRAEIGANWRRHLDYEAEWEQIGGVPAAKRFKCMNALGQAGRTRRETLSNILRRRLETTCGQDGKSHDAVNHGRHDDDGDGSEAGLGTVALSEGGSTEGSG
ncbi:uncharacterized protein RCC_05602 [Ramularia collo-cygni]|uniref:Myb-like domain-containing protein n=1 Tax=Ramularia collo-cygni TaxID=112498 RepID=A0A2D3V4X2_9PEZI|nr:uncharacterized protein RCC_05602 [Ramularia collo-cygni]CZT19747.1 uncharacterized protein RCC_05602 [Ramularia collo-cygni]